ncbi:MAG: hypothetical protein QM765_16580 [Myxococcales bacterium]
MRHTIAAVAVFLGTLSGCTCLEPVDEGGPHDAGTADRDAAQPLRLDAGASTSDASAPMGDAGDLFCTGDQGKLQDGLMVHDLEATSSLVFMNCCDAAELVFHTRDALGDVTELLLSVMGGPMPSGEVAIGMDPKQAVAASMTIGASYYGSGMSAAAYRFEGTLGFSQASPGAAQDVKVCLTLDAPQGPHHGVRLYAPAVRVMGYGDQKRFALYLLADATMDAVQAASRDLAALTLAAEPLLDLYSLRYYEGADHRLAFTMDMTMERLKSALGTVPLSGKPFVVVADGERIYLGAFWSPLSSSSPATPFVMLETSDTRGITIERRPQADTEPDVRTDARITRALRETGKLAP